MDEDDVFDALGELYRDGHVDMAPTVGNVDPSKQQFSMTDQGVEHAHDMMRESDDMVLFLIGLILKDAQPFDSQREIAEQLIEFSEWFAEDSGINPLRVVNRNVGDVPWINGELPDELVEYYDDVAEKGKNND